MSKSLSFWKGPAALSGPPYYPATAAEFADLTGMSAQWGRTFQEASGNLALGWGSGDLVVAGSPTFQHDLGNGRLGVLYPGSSSNAHRANINGLDATTSGIYACVFEGLNTSGAQVRTIDYEGYNNGTNPKRVLLLLESNRPFLYVQSDGNTVSASGTPGSTLGGVFFGVLQIDRAAAKARARVSNTISVINSFEVSILGFGSFVQAASGNWFGCGDNPAPNLNERGAGGWGVVSTGPQCEGSGVPAALAASLGWA